jgi:hypothetical protein
MVTIADWSPRKSPDARVYIPDGRNPRIAEQAKEKHVSRRHATAVWVVLGLIIVFLGFRLWFGW